MKKIIGRFKSPAEFWVLLMAFLISLYFFIGSFKFFGTPRFFPRLTSLSSMVFFAAYAVTRIRRKKGEEPEKKETGEQEEKNRAIKNTAITVGFFAAYLIIARLFGFLIAAIFMAILYPLAMGYRKPAAIAVSFIINTGIVLGFQKLIGLSLTQGRLLDLTRLFF